MTEFKRTFFILLAGMIGLGWLGLSREFPVAGIGGPISTAEARVGRPLTPVSVAGSARRTVRRCAAGVYNC